MTADSKLVEYCDLVAARKACDACASILQNASRISNGKWDSDRIGPYTQWQGNLDSPLVVIAQDFADTNGFTKYGGWAGHDVQTNKRLVELLNSAGCNLALPDHGNPDDVLFFTNAVLCMKSGSNGGRQQPIPTKCFVNCAGFLRKTVEIVSPKVVVTLGTGALRATLMAYGQSIKPKLSMVVGKAIPLRPGLALVPMYHPSPTVVNTSRPMSIMQEDWSRLGSFMRIA